MDWSDSISVASTFRKNKVNLKQLGVSKLRYYLCDKCAQPLMVTDPHWGTHFEMNRKKERKKNFLEFGKYFPKKAIKTKQV